MSLTEYRRIASDWQAYPSPHSTVELGREWLEAAKTLLLKVPSTLIIRESNYLINPLHPDFTRIDSLP